MESWMLTSYKFGGNVKKWIHFELLWVDWYNPCSLGACYWGSPKTMSEDNFELITNWLTMAKLLLAKYWKEAILAPPHPTQHWNIFLKNQLRLGPKWNKHILHLLEKVYLSKITCKNASPMYHVLEWQAFIITLHLVLFCLIVFV